MALVFDLAEAINMLAATALGETTSSLKERLADITLRRSIAKAFRRAVQAEAGLDESQRKEVLEVVSDPYFIALICGEPVSEPERSAVVAQFASAADELNESVAARLVVHLRDAAVQAIESSLPLATRVLHRSVRQVSQQVTDLSNIVRALGEGPRGLTREVLGQLDPMSYRPNSPALPSQPDADTVQSRTGGHPYVSALALSIADVLSEFPAERILTGRLNADLILDAYRAVDRLIQGFEQQAVIVLDLLEKADYVGRFYGSAGVGTSAVITANLRLLKITEQMREISRRLGRVPAMERNFKERIGRVAGLCIQIGSAEDFLVVRLLSGDGGHYNDNRDSPFFPSELGQRIVDDFSRTLMLLFRYRSALQAEIAHAMAEVKLSSPDDQ
jgi:hypothetical protein